MSFPPDITAQISSQICRSYSLEPSKDWLSTFLQSQKPTIPLTSLVATARTRILNSDITTSLSSTDGLPSNIHDATIKERRLAGTIIVQVLDVEGISFSRWSQIESIEAVERGESTKGREMVRLSTTATADSETPMARNQLGPLRGGCSKLLVQDTNGTKAWAFELKPVPEIGSGLSIGAKMLFTEVLVARAVLLIEPKSTNILGGKIDAYHQKWMETRKTRLKAAIEAEQES